MAKIGQTHFSSAKFTQSTKFIIPAFVNLWKNGPTGHTALT